MAIAPIGTNTVAPTTATGPTDAELRQQAVDSALSQLQNLSVIQRQDGSSWDANQYFGPGVIDGWKAPFADNISKLADSNLSPSEVKDAANQQISDFQNKTEFMRAVRFLIMDTVVRGMNEMNADNGMNDWQQSPT